MNKLKPGLPSGFNDYLPEEESIRNKMIDTVKRSFELFGFLAMDTPSIEEERTLTGGDAGFKKQIFRIKKEDGGEDLALRFDLTVPLARIVSSYPNEITFPFKRYQIGKVWRGEKPQAGRYREFLQFDADTVGSGSIMADAEIIALMNQTMSSLGFQNFLIKINNRKILNGLPKYAGFPDKKLEDVLRAIDKLDKVGRSGVLKELSDKDGAGLDKEESEKIMKFFDVKAKDNKEVLKLAEEKLSVGEAREGFAEMKELVSHLESFGVPDDKWSFDFSTVRGFSYYTGFVFETILLDSPEIGSVFSGGRYDGLMTKMGGDDLPAVGVSVGVDRMFFAIKKLGFMADVGRASKVMILNFSEKAVPTVERTISLLRVNGIPSEVYLGREKTLKGQLSFALKNNYEAVIIIGEDEILKNTVTVKDFKSYKQWEIKETDLIPEIKKII